MSMQRAASPPEAIENEEEERQKTNSTTSDKPCHHPDDVDMLEEEKASVDSLHDTTIQSQCNLADGQKRRQSLIMSRHSLTQRPITANVRTVDGSNDSSYMLDTQIDSPPSESREQSSLTENRQDQKSSQEHISRSQEARPESNPDAYFFATARKERAETQQREVVEGRQSGLTSQFILSARQIIDQSKQGNQSDKSKHCYDQLNCQLQQSLRTRQTALGPKQVNSISTLFKHTKESETRYSSICDLPYDLHFVLASYLEPQEILIKIQALSKKWRLFVLNPALWVNLVRNWPEKVQLTPFQRLRNRKLITCRRSRGTVLIAEDRLSGATSLVRAINVVTSNGCTSDGLPTSVLRQISQNQILTHPNIAKYDKIFYKDSAVVLVRNYLTYDLRDFIRQHKVNHDLDTSEVMAPFPRGLPRTTIQSLTREILKGLAHCHSLNIMHRNLKPENILIDSAEIAKKSPDSALKVCVSDFALSRSVQTPHLEKYTPEDPKERERSGRESRRLYYRAPELMFRPSLYGPEIDMWSVGCLLAEMALSEPLFKQSSEIELLLGIFRLTGSPSAELIQRYQASASDQSEKPMVAFPAWTRLSFDEICSGQKYPEIDQRLKRQGRQKQAKMLKLLKEVIGCDGIDLLQKLLELDPAKRLTARQALDHPFITNDEVDGEFQAYNCHGPGEALVEMKQKQALTQLDSVEVLSSATQGFISDRMRLILVDWLFDVSEHFKLCDRTTQLAVAYLDRFLTTERDLARSQLQLLGVSALKLADCFNETSREFFRMLSAHEYASMTTNEFSAAEIIAMEQRIVNTLDFKIDLCTVSETIALSGYSERGSLCFMASYLSDLVQLSSRLTCRWTVKILAIACLVLASIELGSEQTFELGGVLARQREQVVDCVLQLHQVQFEQMQVRNQLRNNQLDATNRKWKERLRRCEEARKLTTEEVTAIKDVQINEFLCRATIESKLECYQL